MKEYNTSTHRLTLTILAGMRHGKLAVAAYLFLYHTNPF